MAMFSYEARNELGELVAGVVNADSVREASDQLCRKQLYVVKLGASDRKGQDAGAAKTKQSRHSAKRQDVMWFVSQLSIMVETGIPLSEGLECLARQTESASMQPILESLSKSVAEGRSLSDVMSEFPRAFPTTMVALIRAAEMSGTLSAVLKRVSDYLVKEHQVNKRIKGAMAYPAFMMFICIAVTVFLLVFILPKFAKIFAARGAALPGPTRFLMAISDALINHWMLVTFGVVGVVLAIRSWSRTNSGKVYLDRSKLVLPVVSIVFNKLYQSRSFRTLGTLLHSGVALTDAIEITAEVCGNVYYMDLWQRVGNAVCHGENIAAPLKESPLIPESIEIMIESGDRSGQLGLVFNRLAGFVEEEYDQAIKTLMQFIEPTITIVMGSVVGFIALSVLMPMFQVSKVIAH